jgi:hypothetical protein
LIARSSNLLDVVFVVGSSTGEDFEKAKTSILSTVNTQTNNDPNYGVIQYDNSVSKEIPIKQFTNLDEFKSQVKELVWRNPGILVDDGIDAGRRMLVEEGRPLARRRLVIFTDKKIESNSSDLQESVEAATGDDIRILTLFFGKPKDQTKVSILTPNDPEPSVILPTDDGEKIAPEVTTKVFKGAYICILCD